MMKIVSEEGCSMMEIGRENKNEKASKYCMTETYWKNEKEA